MSNIIKNKDGLILLKDIITYTQGHELTVDYLENVLVNLLPYDNNKPLVGHYIREKGSITAMFTPDSNIIILSINKINEWLDKQTEDFIGQYNISNKNEFKSYMFLFMLTHEIEHAYQFLIGKEIVSSPNDVLKNAYQGLFDLMIKKDYIVPRPITIFKRLISKILYSTNENLYLLERNANILSMELVGNCALYDGNEQIYKIFDNMMRTYLICGYTDNNVGSIEETYRGIYMYNKYRKFYHDIDINDKDKVRYGFKIDDETRNKVLKLKMNI